MVIRLTLPLPPTANTYYRRVGRKTLISAKGRAYRKAAHLAGLAQHAEPLDGGVGIAATVYMARKGCDLDNRAKPLLDALHGVLYDDDVQVVDLRLVKRLDRKNPRVELEAWPMNPTEEE